MSDINTVVGYAAADKPVEFEQALDQVLLRKAAERIEAMRHDVANRFFMSTDAEDPTPVDQDHNEDAERDSE